MDARFANRIVAPDDNQSFRGLTLEARRINGTPLIPEYWLDVTVMNISRLEAIILS